MFIGHFAVGFASKQAAPRASLGPLMAAPLLLDLLWPIFLLLGIETVRIDPGNTAFTPLDLHDYPYSHSLVMSLVWAVAFGGLYYGASRYARGALVIAAGVFSHWVLDFVTHRPDLPLFPHSARFVGLGLWNSRGGTIAVETTMFAIGVWLYARSTRARNRVGSVALAALIATLSLMYVATVLGPPPPNARVLAWLGIVAWLFVPWAWWIDRNRAVVDAFLE
jgi:membrane-bound metal-dependent hydrolase YbcI (DUF457 family)